MANYLIEKDQAFLNEILFDALPELFPTEENQMEALSDPKIYNIPYLVEKAMAKIGNMEYVDEEGYDFLPCKSDSKTTSLNITPQTANPVAVFQTKAKVGALRICVFNPYKHKGNQIDFFYVPRDAYNRSVSFTYNLEKSSYLSMEEYRVPDFVTLSEKTEHIYTTPNTLAEFIA